MAKKDDLKLLTGNVDYDGDIENVKERLGIKKPDFQKSFALKRRLVLDVAGLILTVTAVVLAIIMPFVSFGRVKTGDVNGVIVGSDADSPNQSGSGGAGAHEHVFGPDNVCTICGYAPDYTRGLDYERVTVGATDTYVVCGMGVAETDIVVIPAYIDGIPVTAISQSAFENNAVVAEVTLPDSLTDVGNAAFKNCENLAKIYLGSGVENIGEDCFAGTKIEDLTLPESVKAVGERAFMGCGQLKSVTLPDGLESLGAQAFSGCEKIADLVIGDGLRVIEKEAFAYADIKNLTIGAGVAAIEDNAFNTLYTRPETITYNGDLVGWLNIERGQGLSELLRGCKTFYVGGEPLENAVIPASVGSVSAGLKYCPTLKSVTIADGVTEICDEAFFGCKNLESAVIPDSVLSVGAYAFYQCEKLVGVKLPVGLTEIADYTFAYCYALATIDVPFGVNKIGKCAFTNAQAIKKIDLPYVAEVGDYAFGACSFLESVTLGDCVYEIGYGCFSGCRALSEISFGSGLKRVGGAAFNGCTSLTALELCDGLEDIGDRAFEGCKNLEYVVLPESLISVGANVFSGAVALKAVYYSGTAESWAYVSVGAGFVADDYLYFYSDERPSAAPVGTQYNYWHYDDNGNVEIWGNN